MVYETSVLHKSKKNSHYSGKTIVLATKHKKADALALPLKAGLGARLQQVDLDTDRLGTFTGEIERQGTPFDTAVKKARMGMTKTGSALGLANEGSFGPHPFIPFIPGCQELIVLIDDELGITVTESIITAQTNYRHIEVSRIEEAEEFLKNSKFPSHGLIVRPNKYRTSLLGKISRVITGELNDEPIYKGLRDKANLATAIDSCRESSFDGLARIETDMRAHMNPTRVRVLRTLGIKLARRLHSTCPECACPGYGVTAGAGFLPCEECGYPSEAPALEVNTCSKCKYQKTVPRRDGVTQIEANYCQRCNP